MRDSLAWRDVAMKMCVKCNRLNPDDTEKCIECGGEEFIEVLFPLEREECMEHMLV